VISAAVNGELQVSSATAGMAAVAKFIAATQPPNMSHFLTLVLLALLVIFDRLRSKTTLRKQRLSCPIPARNKFAAESRVLDGVICKLYIVRMQRPASLGDYLQSGR
jgi:hypothetical protein